jgi:hypothetical protein
MLVRARHPARLAASTCHLSRGRDPLRRAVTPATRRLRRPPPSPPSSGLPRARGPAVAQRLRASRARSKALGLVPPTRRTARGLRRRVECAAGQELSVEALVEKRGPAIIWSAGRSQRWQRRKPAVWPHCRSRRTRRNSRGKSCSLPLHLDHEEHHVADPPRHSPVNRVRDRRNKELERRGEHRDRAQNACGPPHLRACGLPANHARIGGDRFLDSTGKREAKPWPPRASSSRVRAAGKALPSAPRAAR